MTVYAGDAMIEQCWFSGAPYADPYWDHVIWESSLNGKHPTYGYSTQGHVADEYVNFSGRYPFSGGVSLPHCG